MSDVPAKPKAFSNIPSARAVHARQVVLVRASLRAGVHYDARGHSTKAPTHSR